MKTVLKKRPFVRRCALAAVFSAIVSGTCLAEGIGIAPQVDVAPEGKAIVKWETRHDCVGAVVSFGLCFEDDPFGLPYYRLRVSGTGTPRSHSAEASLKDIEQLAGGTPHNGIVFYRATCFDLKSGSWLDSGDCVFRYLKSADSYRRGVAITEGPIVANVTSSSVLIRWVTDFPAAGRVCIGEKSWKAPLPEREHEVVVDGLRPSTTYSYRVQSSTTPEDLLRTRSYTFRTAPPPGSAERFTFAVFSDTRADENSPVSVQALNGTNADVLRQIAIAVFRRKARFAIVPGDLISGVTTNVRKAKIELRSWKKAVGPVAHYIPFYTGMGNHDAEIYDLRIIEGKSIRLPRIGRHSAEEIFRSEMSNPTNGPQLPADSKDATYCENVYSFDYGNSHFVMLNNDYKSLGAVPGEREKGKIVGRQLEWLQQDLESASARGLENIFVFFHEPAFPNGGHLDDSMFYKGDEAYVQPRNEFWRLLCRYNVVAVFNGHEHNYSRMLVDESLDKSFSKPIWQIITGGGGAPFHPQERPPWRESVKIFSSRQHYCIVAVGGQKVRLRVYDLAGNLIDKADLR